MTDTTTLIGDRRPPTNIIAASVYNPLAGPTNDKLFSFPVGTPVVQSLGADGTVIPGQADSVDTAFVLGVAATPGIVGDHFQVQTSGVLTLTTVEWDAVTGDSGGLTRGVPYYLSDGPSNGGLTTTAPSTPGDFVTRVGIGLSPTDFLIMTCCPVAVPRG